jgi:hypothetical protein
MTVKSVTKQGGTMKTRSIKDLDSEIEKRKKLIAKFEADRVARGKRVETLRSKREALSLAAKSGDIEAQKKLDAIHEEQRKVELEIEDFQSAINGANREIEPLRAERELSVQADALVKFDAESKLAVEQAHAIENHATELIKLLVEHNTALGKLTTLSNTAGRPKLFRFAACRRGLLYKLGEALPGEYTRPDRLYKRSYAQFLENFVKLDGDGETDKASGDE